MQVSPVLDARRLRAAAKAAGRDVTFAIAPRADHFLKEVSASVEPTTVAAMKAHVDRYNAEGRQLDQEVVMALVEWLRRQHARRSP